MSRKDWLAGSLAVLAGCLLGIPAQVAPGALGDHSDSSGNGGELVHTCAAHGGSLPPPLRLSQVLPAPGPL
jgi:hypothetical protein